MMMMMMLFTELHVTFDGEIASLQKSITLNFSRDDIKRTNIALCLSCLWAEEIMKWHDSTWLRRTVQCSIHVYTRCRLT